MSEAKKPAKFRLTVSVYLDGDAKCRRELYISGNHASLGAWNPLKAVPLKPVINGSFRFSKLYLPGESIEFKILRSREADFSGVEKGLYREEISNHTAFMDGNKFVPVVICNFR